MKLLNETILQCILLSLCQYFFLLCYFIKVTKVEDNTNKVIIIKIRKSKRIKHSFGRVSFYFSIGPGCRLATDCDRLH